MAGVEYHDTLVGQNHKGWVVVVVGLEIGADEHVGLPSCKPVVLCGLHIAVHINITDVGGVDGLAFVFVVEGAWVSKPAPCSLICHDVAFELLLRIQAADGAHSHGKKENKSFHVRL